MRRVVVTGMGAVTPLGLGVEHIWQQILQGKSGIRATSSCDCSDLPSKISGEVPIGTYDDHKFEVTEWIESKEANRNDKFIWYALSAAHQALKQSGLENLTEEQSVRAGVSVGSGIGGLQKIYTSSVLLENGDYKKISPFFIPSLLVNLAAGRISINHQLRGPNLSMATACATGAHSIGDAFLVIKNNQADIMVAGGSEAAVCRLGIAGFSRMGALSTNFNDRPEEASRPWDKQRDGFVISEGAGVLVLEELEYAKKRGATIYAELVGYGMSGDASHITAPSGSGAVNCIKSALRSAELNPEDIGYINAHGTSTPVGDLSELNAIKEVFGTNVPPVSSTKSATGHLLGAAGAVEAIFSILACRDGILPPTLNLHDPDEGCDIDLVPLKSKEKKIQYAFSNSFGFGGTNAALIFKKS